MAQSCPYGTLPLYPDQGDPVPYSASSGRVSTGESSQLYPIPDIHEQYRVGPRGGAPPPLEASLYIGYMGRKEEMCPLTLRALSLEIFAKYGRGYASACPDSSSTGGTGNGGYGIYILWPDGTSWICGPVE
ncbi:hypothetical protein PoB_000850600 [Plakobranchus ocellatus]|uniref:Uncharacterized protein n=1 Tax=Plakobranchus ocellatus TaxID=259542 RepID=A0AAV3YHY4_9GAST|nr:hypothetical protein PoB_000850600 [Plakobranchus ocellatus]